MHVVLLENGYVVGGNLILPKILVKHEDVIVENTVRDERLSI